MFIFVEPKLNPPADKSFDCLNDRMTANMDPCYKVGSKFPYGLWLLPFSFMASSIGRQDEPNCTLQLATQAGKMKQSHPASDYLLYPARKISPKAI